MSAEVRALSPDEYTFWREFVLAILAADPSLRMSEICTRADLLLSEWDRRIEQYEKEAYPPSDPSR